MNGEEEDEFGSVPLLELFRSEAESQAQVLTEGLLALERDTQALATIEPLMRAAHSLKGAARIVGLEPIERLAHAMEDCFVAAQKGSLQLTRNRIDRLLAGVDVIGELARLKQEQIQDWMHDNETRIAGLLIGLYEASDTQAEPMPVEVVAAAPAPIPPPPRPPAKSPPPAATPIEDPVLRVNVRRFDRLLALASEARVATHVFGPQLKALQRLRQKQHEVLLGLDQVREASHEAGERTELETLRQRVASLEHTLGQRLAELDAYERRALSLSRQLLDEVLDLRMRPFRDAVLGFPRIVRDLARSLGKEVHLDIAGADTLVDRDLLMQMEAPLNQLLRNAVDHGLEPPETRVAAGKARAGTIRLEARHGGGMLQIKVGDDGHGLDPEQIRRTLVARGMGNAQMAAAMSTAELLDFLLLPGFSLKEATTAISGRGVGLDVVAEAVRRANGSMRLESNPGKGFQVLIMLPLSQSLLRALTLTAAGEMLALPLACVGRVLRVPVREVHALADRQFFTLDGQHVDLIPLAPLLELGPAPAHAELLPVVVIGAAARRYGLVVDDIAGERSLAVQPLPAAFGKLRDVAGTALLEDGSPVLVLDHADLLQGIEKLAGEGGLQGLPAQAKPAAAVKRVLVVDDSLTVREMQRKLLHTRGYRVDVAVDGMDGWNAVRGGGYDLVITDVDMPRLDGIELVSLIKKDEHLRHLPVMIVSYKDRPEDRTRGIDAGADYYLAKGSFHDETLLEAVADLIGESGA